MDSRSTPAAAVAPSADSLTALPVLNCSDVMDNDDSDSFASDDEYIAQLMSGAKRLTEEPESATPQPAEASSTSPVKPTTRVRDNEPGTALLRQFASLDDIIQGRSGSSAKQSIRSDADSHDKVQKRKGLFSPPGKTMRKTAASGGGTDVDMSRFVKDAAADLQEPKVTLLRRAIEVLGMTMFRALLHEVQEVEESGGQWTAAGDRRRTPGGVFWNLLRQKVSKEDYNTIFAEEKEKERERCKKRQKERNLKEALRQGGRSQLAARVGVIAKPGSMETAGGAAAGAAQVGPPTPTAAPPPTSDGRLWSAVVRPAVP